MLFRTRLCSSLDSFYLKLKHFNKDWNLINSVYKHLTDLNEVQVIPFYLGINGRGDGQNFHLWRCLFRIRNLGKKVVKLQDIKLDTSTLDGYYTSLEESLTENLVCF
uniref:Uncharacterized protein n=1 Tax=Meloidogyne incognita TaxID=6306 RepID=A0A914NGN2_MELIC